MGELREFVPRAEGEDLFLPEEKYPVWVDVLFPIAIQKIRNLASQVLTLTLNWRVVEGVVIGFA